MVVFCHQHGPQTMWYNVPTAAGMKAGKGTKQFPMPFQAHTAVDANTTSTSYMVGHPPVCHDEALHSLMKIVFLTIHNN